MVSRRFRFVTLDAAGHRCPAGPAPYLDYRGATEGERRALPGVSADAWLAKSVESAGLDYAIEAVVPAHLGEVRARTQARGDKVSAAVKARLAAEINYWDARAVQLAARRSAATSRASTPSGPAPVPTSPQSTRSSEELSQDGPHSPTSSLLHAPESATSGSAYT